MDNSKIVKYKDIYKKKAPMQYDVAKDCIRIRDNDCGGGWIGCNLDESTLESVFNGAKLSNFRINNTGYKPNERLLAYGRLIDIQLSNCIVPSTISFDVDDEYHIWRNSKNLKFCHMFSEKLNGQDKKEFPPLTKAMLNKDEYGVYANNQKLELSVDKTERTLFGKIKCNIVVTDYDCHLGCNKAGLPVCVEVLSDEIAGIKVDKERLLEVDDGETFRFFAGKDAKYDGVKIDTDKPITCRYQNGEIKVVHFIDKQGKEYKSQESKKNEQNAKIAQKDTACKTIKEIISILQLYKNSKYKQKNIATQDYTWLNNLSEAIKNEKTDLAIGDLMNVNSYLNAISTNLKELSKAEELLEQRVIFLNKNVADNLNNLKRICEKNICKTKLKEPKPMSNNDNNNNNNNIQIISENKTKKDNDYDNLNAPPNDNRIEIIEKNIRKTKLVEPKPVSNNNNKQIISENKTKKDNDYDNLNAPPNDNRIEIIEDYVNNNQSTSDQQAVANAIGLLIKNNRADSLEKYSRIFAFSQKDKRAQQVYETYKNIENELNIIDNAPEQQREMYELGNVHSINTPCGCGCL